MYVIRFYSCNNSKEQIVTYSRVIIYTNSLVIIYTKNIKKVSFQVHNINKH